jgi:hypothetical protein
MELGNEFEILRKYGKTITYNEVKYPTDQFEELLSDHPEFYDSIKQDIINKIKQVELPIEDVIVEEDVVEEDTL